MKAEIRRRVHRVLPEPTAEGAHVFKSKSMTRRDGTEHFCMVNGLRFASLDLNGGVS